MEALVALHHQRIHDVVPIKSDTGIRHWTVKRILQEPKTVLIDIDVLKHILQHGRKHVSRIEQFIHPG